MAKYIDESAVLQTAMDTYGSTLQIVVTMENRKYDKGGM